MGLIHIPADTVVLQEGEVCMDMYRIVSGNCEVYSGYGSHQESVLGILSKGAYFGEIGFFSQKPSIYTVVTYSDVELERIVIGEFAHYVHDHYDEVMSLMNNMANMMYNLKHNMDQLATDWERSKNKVDRSNLLIREQLKKYDLLGMHSISFYTGNI